MRKTFAQVLEEGKVDIFLEYSRLYKLMYSKKYGSPFLRERIEETFESIWFRGTALSLDDFDHEYGFNFEENPQDFDITYLVRYCEYFYNFVIHSIYPSDFYVQQIQRVIERIGYMGIQEKGLMSFVERNPAAISVAETLPEDLSYKTLMYDHHSMKGDIEAKKEILLKLGQKLESKRDHLNKANPNLENEIFQMFNKMNLRHNNVDASDKGHYYKYVAEMSKDDLEKWYDELYQMSLLAFLELEQAERKPRVEELLRRLNEKEKE